MRMFEIRLPKYLDPQSASKFAWFVNCKVPPSDKYYYDFSHLQHCPPFGVLVAANAIRQNILRYPHATHSPFLAINKNTEGVNYAGSLGLFQMLGWDEGRKTSLVDSTINCIPISKISLETLADYVSESDRIQGQIDHLCRNLAIRLTRDPIDNATTALNYCLREITRNSFEHSGVDCVWLCAQYWPSKKRTELAIMDEGCGIAASLLSNPHYKCSNDADANKLALQPGVSRTYGAPLSDDRWQNTGYGLYVASSLCLLGGHFILASGHDETFLNPVNQSNYSTCIKGTIICLSLDLESIGNISEKLDLIVKKGEERAKQFGSRIISASKVSSIATLFKAGIETHSVKP